MANHPLSLYRRAASRVMNVPSLTLAFALVAVIGCREHSRPTPQANTIADAEQEKFWRMVSTASDFWALAQAVPRRQSVVIRMWAVGWDTNRLAQVATHLHAAGFDSVRAVALKWGQSLPGPSL